MNVLSACPLRVASRVWQPRPGAFALTVVCKATYALAPGTAPLASVQEEPHALDACWSDDPRASLRHAGDLAPFKRRADVLLVGHAYAPGGQPVTALVARLMVGEIDKEIAVYGDRFFTRDGRVGEPSPFTRMPLRWERAAGGPGTPNPVGVALDAPPDRLGRVPVPNLQPPDAQLGSSRDTLEPVGFGPVAPGWPGRVAHLRRHAASWDALRWHEKPLPDDLDAGYFNAAPPDQQTSDLRPDARLVLTNLHPEHARLVTSLQPIVPRAVCSTGSGPAQEVRLRCDTLCVDTDRGVLSMVWRGIVQLEHPAQVGQVVVTAEGADAGASLSERVGPATKLAATTTFDLASLSVHSALPFSPGSVVTSAATQTGPLSLPGLARAHAQLGGTTGIDPAIVRAAALPFGPGSGIPTAESPPALPGLALAHARFGGTTGIDPAIVRAAAMPFGAAPGVPSAEPPPSALALPGLALAHARFGGTTGIDPAIVRAAALPFGASQRPPESVSVPAITEQPAPPPRMATPERVPEVPLPAPAPAAVPEQEAAAPQVDAPAPPPLPLEAYPIERCAAIAASLARRRPDRAATLEQNDLDEEVWEALDLHWREAIREAAARGKTALLRAYDEAYVAQLEAERGAIAVEEYARILVAAERGTEKQALAELGLPRGALLRVQRVWMRKMAGSKGLGRRVREAMEAAREG